MMHFLAKSTDASMDATQKLVCLATHGSSLEFIRAKETTPEGFTVTVKGVRLTFYCDRICSGTMRCQHRTPIEDFETFTENVNLAGKLGVLSKLKNSQTMANRDFEWPNAVGPHLEFALLPELEEISLSPQ